jgi:SNF2 family DNA or RNA helicase
MQELGEVSLKVEGDSVIVSQPALLKDRTSRLFFGSILGGVATEDGWICPRHRLPPNTLVVRINTFLENKGWRVARVGIANEAVKRELERKRSFHRAQEKAKALKDGVSQIDLVQVKSTLKDFGWNEANRSLFLYQEHGLIHGLTAVNAANFSVPGSGKTATTLAVAATHLATGTIDLVLVVGPLSCFAPWEREVRTALRSNQVLTKRIRGTTTERRARYATARQGQLLLVSYASAAADRVPIIDLCKTFKVMLIVDESHRVKRFRGGIWAPALMEISQHARVRTILSGTPMPQSGKDLYSQLQILWPAGELTGARDDFAARVRRDFPSVLRDIQPFVSRTPKQALGLRPYEVARHTVPISGTQGEIYDLIASHFRRQIQGAATWKDKIETLRRGRPIRLLQAAANPDLLNRVDSFYKLPRLDTPNPSLMERLSAYRATDVAAKSIAALKLVSDIASKGGKVVCWSNFVPNLDQFSESVRKNVRIPCFQIDGRVPTGDEMSDDDRLVAIRNAASVDTREQIIEKFLDTEGPAALVTNPASCSESISLHRTCHTAIYLDRTYDCALFLQSIDRIHRLGLPPDVQVRIHILLATLDGQPTIDQLVDAALSRKEAAMRQLLEGAELRPFELSEDPMLDAQGTEEDLSELLRFLLGEEARWQ